ncbi:MAG: 3-phenylpropionate/cinnamic acid dioxygenase subunit beta [Actinobacteria bacterium]|nr:3-phenylpropionate/cinnamic acid dioxygenase subunit beta [Actinomycetota bacterium]
MSAGLAVDLETRLAVSDFLIAEAAALDERRFEDWLELFTDDVEYVAPVRVTRRSGTPDIVDEITYFDENKQSLGLRVKRLLTDVAWAEDPPSMTRRFVSNIRITPGDGELAVKNNLLLFRSRGDSGAYDLIVGEREDALREEGGELRICRRRAVIDQAALGTKNLGVFL